jgi:hypothetical protein
MVRGLRCLGKIHPALKRALDELRIDDEFIREFPESLILFKRINACLWSGRFEDVSVEWIEALILFEIGQSLEESESSFIGFMRSDFWKKKGRGEGLNGEGCGERG